MANENPTSPKKAVSSRKTAAKPVPASKPTVTASTAPTMVAPAPPEVLEKTKSEPVAKPKTARKTAQAKSAEVANVPEKEAVGAAKSVRAGKTPAAAAAAASHGDLPGADEIKRMIEEAAYYLAEKRNFEAGWEAEDWATAEAEVMARLQAGKKK